MTENFGLVLGIMCEMSAGHEIYRLRTKFIEVENANLATGSNAGISVILNAHQFKDLYTLAHPLDTRIFLC